MSLLILNWLKNNWKSIVVYIFTILIGFYVSNQYYKLKENDINYNHAQEILALSSEHDKSINKMSQVVIDSIEKQKLLNLEYQNNLELLQRDFEYKSAELEKLKKLKTAELVRQINEDPEGALERIANEYGFEIVVVQPEE